MPTMSEQASRFAARPTAGWWDERVRSEIRYTILRVRAGHDPDLEYARLQAKLTSLCDHRIPNRVKENAA